jgi:hypothetical protein
MWVAHLELNLQRIEIAILLKFLHYFEEVKKSLRITEISVSHTGVSEDSNLLEHSTV